MFLAKMAAVKHDIYLGDKLKVLHVKKSILLPPAVECEQRIKNERITAQCSFPRFLGWLHEGAVKQDFVHCLTAFTSPQSFTFAGAGGDKSRCFSKFVVDLHISTKHNKSFDQLYVVQLMNKVKHGYFQTDTQRIYFKAFESF